MVKRAADMNVPRTFREAVVLFFSSPTPQFITAAFALTVGFRCVRVHVVVAGSLDGLNEE